MKPQVNRVCSVLAILAACQCASAIDAPFTSFVERIYVTESSSDVGRDKLLLGALVEVNPIDGTELLDSVFVMLPNVWKFIRGLDEVRNTEIRSVALDEMPLEGLFKIGESHPALYPRLLPHLLARSPPEMIADNVPEQLLGFLTPAAGRNIFPIVMKRLMKLSY